MSAKHLITTCLVLMMSFSALSKEASQTMSAQNLLSAMPLAFTENQGQWDEKVLFRGDVVGEILPDQAAYEPDVTIEEGPEQRVRTIKNLASMPPAFGEHIGQPPNELSFGPGKLGPGSVLHPSHLGRQDMPALSLVPRGAASSPDNMLVTYMGSILWTSMYATAISGGLAFCILPYGLVVLDISSPNAPVLVSTLYLGGKHGFDIAVAGSHAYVATFYEGLQIIDISDPSSPTLAGSYVTYG